jgi:DNA-binding transcriptional LysR family regulator
LITLKQLEGFYWVAELGGLEEAADRLNATQSAISKRVLELEAILKITLFDRSRRRVQITPQGERLMVLTREILAVRDRILDSSSALSPTFRNLRIGVTELTAMTWLPNLIQRIRSSYPSVMIEPVVEASVPLIDKLKIDDLDVVIVPDTFREAQFEIVPLDSVEFAWMCSPSYLDGVTESSLKALAQYTIIEQLHASSGLGDIVQKWLSDHRVKFENTLSSSSLTALSSLTLSGLGISYLPRRVFDYLTASGQLKIIRSKPALPRIPYVLIYKKAKADEFLRFIASLATDSCDFSRAHPAYLTPR